jgi:AraC-like DNA-binding protein
MSLEAVARAIAFTEDGLGEPLRVGAMAEAAHYSLYHFCRVFGRHTGLSPYTYLVRRRLTLAAEQVIDSGRRIVDIAVATGFESHEGFSRAFARLFSVTPIQARDRGWVANPPRLPALTLEHLCCLQRQRGLVPVISGNPPNTTADGVVQVPLIWPATAAPRQRLGGDDVIERCASFELTGPDDHRLLLDWVVHVWLFVARYELAAPWVRVDPAGTRVDVPVRRSLTRSG